MPARRPGSHKWGILRHEESDDPRSILAKGQYITDAFDEDTAVDFALRPGEMVLFDNSLVHGSGTNLGPDRRFLLLVEMLPTWAKPPRVRQAARLMRGVDTYGTFDDEPRPDVVRDGAGELVGRGGTHAPSSSSRTARSARARPTAALAPRPEVMSRASVPCKRNLRLTGCAGADRVRPLGSRIQADDVEDGELGRVGSG